MAIYKTENHQVLWYKDPNREYGAVAWNNSTPNLRFGLHEDIQAPDPEIEWTPQYSAGSTRNRTTIFAGKWNLRGSIPDIRLQASDREPGGAAEVLALILGNSDISADGKHRVAYENIATYDTRIPFFTMQIAAKSTTGSDWIRNYYGGKVNRASIYSGEGEDLRLSLEDILFKDIRTNATGSGSLYSDLVTLGEAPTLNPRGRFLFSGATLNFEDIVLARVKQFRLSIDNQLEPKYYLTRNLTTIEGVLGADRNNGHQVLAEIVEHKRLYSLDLELDFVDSESDFRLFNYLLNTTGTGADGKALKGMSFVAYFNASEGLNNSNTLQIYCSMSPKSLASGTPGIVLEKGSVNIPTTRSGYMTGSYRMNVSSVTIYVPTVI